MNLRQKGSWFLVSYTSFGAGKNAEKIMTHVQAAKTNTPVFERQVNTTQTIWQVPLDFTNSKETLTFVWNVQATDNKGKPYGADKGISEPTIFIVKGILGSSKTD